jgi:aminopeptidase
MTDPRVAKLADLLVNYSLELRPGQIVRLDGGTVAAPFVRELYRSALRAGANPRTRVEVEGLDVIAVGEATEEQLTFVSEIDRFEIENVDAIVTIWADRNTRALSQADPDRVSKKIASRRQLTNRFWERIDEGKAKWVGTRFPTEAHAQDAEMSLLEYEDFVYGACHVRAAEDPVAHWRAVSLELSARARELNTFTELRVVGPDTDLRLNMAGREWLAADGKLNMPDGEIFTSPVETETEGEIRFCVSRVGASCTPRPATETSSCSHCSTWTRAHGSSARLHSGSTTRSTASRATSSLTKRSAARCTSRSARASRCSAAETSPGSTGT